MSQIQVNNSPETGKEPKKLGAVYAYTVIFSFTVVIFLLGILIGKSFFWNKYDKNTFADRQTAALQSKLQENPKDPKALTDLGWNYFQKGDYNKALSLYKQAVESDGKYFPAHLNLGIAYIQAKKYELAIESLKTAVSLSPKSAITHLNLGIAYSQSGKYEEAIGEFELSDQEQPGNVEVMYQIGLAYEKLQKYDEAANEYNAALNYNPKYSLAQDALNRIKDKLTKQ